ncbi:MAG TPA: MliC family protein [Longimicrobiales bacterium]|nr:MliC family protein [Longimicrobiales bacterium]
MMRKRSRGGTVSRRVTVRVAIMFAAGAAAACSVEPAPDREAATDTAGADSATPSTAAAPVMSFVCDDMFRFSVRFEGDSATLFLPDTALVLESTVAASGARYARAGIEFWQSGDEAMLTVDGTHYPGCQARDGADPFTAALLRGVRFRAVGQEPGWYLEVEEAGAMRFVGDYGERTVITPAPAPTVTGERTEYRAVTDAHELHVLIEGRPCSDAMSGERFPATVTVTVDGDAYHGCGRWLGSGA